MITMIKDIMNANDTAVPNSREMAILKENFPSCFKADGSFDIERFKEFLSDKIAVTGEGYELKFLGKNYEGHDDKTIDLEIIDEDLVGDVYGRLKIVDYINKINYVQ